MSAKVFISHSSNDHKVAKTICTALEHRGLVCWMASRDVGPGQNYMDAIVRAIRDAKVMVLVFSQNANISSEILKELSLASKYKVNVIPARIEDVVPSEAFELEFATRQWIDLFDNWEHEIERLTSWIISIVSIEPNTDAAAKRAGTAVNPSSPPIPKTPPALIIENRSELLKSESETPTIDKKEVPLPWDNAAKSQTTSSPEELRDIKEAEGRRRADEARVRREVQAVRLTEEEERQAKEDADRERQQEAEAKRGANEQERRRQAEAEARQQAKDGRRAEEAEAKRRAEQEQAFSAAKSTDTISAVDKLLVGYPADPVAAEEARVQRAMLLAREAHSQAMASDDPAALKAFLCTYPSGPPADEVRRRLRHFEPQQVWRPSTRALSIGGALLVGAVGIWLITALPSVQPSPTDGVSVSRPTTLPAIPPTLEIASSDMGLVVPKSLRVNSASELYDASVCMHLRYEAAATKFFSAQSIKYRAITFREDDDVIKLFDAGRCDVLVATIGELKAYRNIPKNVDKFLLFLMR